MDKQDIVEKVMELFTRSALVHDELLTEYLPVIFFLAQDYYFNYIDNFEPGELTKSIQERSSLSILDKLNLIEDFYQEFGFPFSISEPLSNGSLDIEVKDYNGEEDVYDGRTLGLTQFEDEHISVTCEDCGTLFDTVSWVHELAHYNNISPKGENENTLLTESMSFIMTLLYDDYLKEKGYEEATEYIARQFYGNFLIIENYYYFIIFLTVYNETGSIDPESFKNVFGICEEYDTYLNRVIELFEEEDLEQLLWHVQAALRYIIADYISIYLYEEYKSNPQIIENIIRYNEKIKHPTNIEDIMHTIGLSEVNTKLFNDKVGEALNKFTIRLKNELNAQKKKKI